MLLIAETQNEKYKKQLENSQVHDFEAVSAEKEKYEALVKRLSHEIEELKGEDFLVIERYDPDAKGKIKHSR